MSGPLPKPVEQKRREGNPGHRPLPAAVLLGGRIRPEDRAPSAPPHFSAAMRTIWHLVIADLRAGGILDRADLFLVEAFAVALGRAREVRQYLEGLRTKDDPFAHLFAARQEGEARWRIQQLLATERETLKEVRLLAPNLGLSPAARAALGIDLGGRMKPAGRDPIDGVLPEQARGRLRVVGGEDE